MVLEVVGGTVYLMRGVRAWLQNGDDKNGLGNYDQEIISLDRYQAGVWDALLGNTYPTQDDEANSYDGQRISILDGDMALDADGNAYLAWIDNGEAWDTQNTLPRLRTTTVVSTTAAPQVTKHYYATLLVGAGGQRIATRVDGDLYYVLGDHLGSTSLVTDDQGNEVGHVIYDTFGQIVANTISLTLTDRLFTGQVFDASTGLYYYNARYYDPFVGQFTQPDSLVADPLNPAAWNRFSYVRNSPTNCVDPSGHNPLVVLALVAGVGGLVGGAAYISQHPFDPAYILEQPTAPQSIEFYKAVVGGELLAASFLIPFSPIAVPGQIRWAIIGAHVTTYKSDIAHNYFVEGRNGLDVLLPRSRWQTYVGNAVGATIAGSMQWRRSGFHQAPSRSENIRVERRG